MVTTKLIVNPRTGLVDSPLYPCVKAEGLCRLRATGEEFHCVKEFESCRYLAKGKGK